MNHTSKKIIGQNGLDTHVFSIQPHRLHSHIKTCISHIDHIFSLEVMNILKIHKSFDVWEMSGAFSRSSDFFTKRLELQTYSHDTEFLKKLSTIEYGTKITNAIAQITTWVKPYITQLLNTDDKLYYRFRIWKYIMWENGMIQVDAHTDKSLCNLFFFDSDQDYPLTIENTKSLDYKNVDYQKAYLTIFGDDIQRYNKNLTPTIHAVKSSQEARIVLNLSVLDQEGYNQYLENAIKLYT